jgi:hypothetical protein
MPSVRDHARATRAIGPGSAGQAAVDYLALIALLALLIGAAAAVAGGGAPSVTNAVLGQVRHALCIVTGRTCPAEQQLPCVVAGDRDTSHIAVSIAIVRVDRERIVARERLSDGSVRLTLSRRSAAGIEGGIGARARVKLKGRTFGADRELRGGVEGVIGWGEVFVARDDRQADEILRALRRPHLPIVGGPHPREIFVEGGARALGRVGLVEGAAGASLEGLAEAVTGARRDQRSGEITISLAASASGWGLVSALTAAPSSSSDGHVGLALTLDRHRRATQLSLTASGTLAKGAMLLPELTGLRGKGSGQAATADMDGRRWELGARVDLHDPAVAAAWAAYRRDPTDPAAVRALGDRLRENAHIDVRSYALTSDSAGIGAGVALGVKLGGELERTHDRSRLLSAATRPPGGLWEQRIDCVAT